MFLFGALIGGASASKALSESPPGVANDQDKQVLQVALLHLLAADDFDTDIGKKRAQHSVIVLSARTPERTGMTRPEQTQHDLAKGHRIPDDIQRDLLRRNEQPGIYHARVASFRGLSFDRRIVISEIAKRSTRELFESERVLFEKAYPTARGYAKAFLPGYSQDGSHAVVRALVGPSPHGGTATVLLQRIAGTWVVKWYDIAWYL